MKSRFLDKNVSLPLQIIVWLFAFYLAWKIVPKGFDKLEDIAKTIDFFAKLGYPAFLAYVVGVLEIIAPLAIFIPRISFYGAVPTAVIMFVASYSVNWNTNPLTLGIIALIIAILTRPGYLRKKAQITKISI
jgi:uncharacterized membrane protein YphA (DoxX/SURF4 family)